MDKNKKNSEQEVREQESSPSEEHESSAPKGPDGQQTLSGHLLQRATIIYFGMAGIGLILMHFAHQSIAKSWLMTGQFFSLTQLLSFALLGTGVLLILSYFFEEYFPSFGALKKLFMPILGRCTYAQGIYLAAVSAIGEEILFRGAIQPFVGLFVASIIFGFLHISPEGKISAWTLWAVLAGLMLGWMYEATESLWPPILCHFIVNFVSMARLRYEYKLVSQQLKENAGGDDQSLLQKRPHQKDI